MKTTAILKNGLNKYTFFIAILLISLNILLFIFFLPLIFELKEKFCQELVPAKSEFGRSTIIDQSRLLPGFTLFISLNATKGSSQEGIVYLTDLYGKPVHKWITKNKAQYSILEPNGNLMTTQAYVADNNYPLAGRFTSIRELDPDSNIVWEYNNGAMHHDFDLLPNGNIAVLIWEKVPSEKSRIVEGGRSNSQNPSEDTIYADTILEIDRNKKIVWSWNVTKYLDQADYKISNFFPRNQWTHANSIKFVRSDPFYHNEAYLVSFRYLNSIFLISKETGDIIWRMPSGSLGHQHDATLLDNGNILVFNNAFYTEDPANPYGYGSQVLEIDPHTNKIVWQFSGGDNPLDRARLTEVILSGAQRLPNGNTFITLGTSGHMFEVTPDKKLVWDMINPYSSPTTEPFPSNYIFKARRYFPEQIPWLKKFGNPLPNIPEYCK